MLPEAHRHVRLVVQADPELCAHRAARLLPGLGRFEAQDVMQDDALRALSPLV